MDQLELNFRERYLYWDILDELNPFDLLKAIEVVINTIIKATKK